MKKISIQATATTPKVEFDNGVFEIKGRSNPLLSNEFYMPIMDAVKEYCITPMDVTIIKIQIDWFNTATSKWLLEILKEFNKIKKRGNEVNLEWYYEDGDEDIFETGDDYKFIFPDMSFEFFKTNGHA